jgi:hypothetical protein
MSFIPVYVHPRMPIPSPLPAVLTLLAALLLASPHLVLAQVQLPVAFDGTQSLPPPQQTLDSPTNCSGWLEPRTYMEAQSWFTR